MLSETIETRARTTRDGMLNLSVSVGLADADVSVIVQVRPLTPTEDVDANGWPKGFFDRVAGSMPELQRAPQGRFEEVTHSTAEFSRIPGLKLEDWET